PALRGMACDLSVAPEYLEAVRVDGPLAIADVRRDPRLAPLLKFMESSCIGATLSHALRTDDLSGVLALDAPSPHHWTEHEAATISQACEYLAIAVQGANTVQERLHPDER